MARKVPTVLTMWDLRKICYEAEPCTYATSTAIGPLKPRPSYDLTGLELHFIFEDESRDYRFERERLFWSRDGQHWYEEFPEYLASTAKPVYLIHHLLSERDIKGASTLIVDLEKEAVTLIDMKIGTILSNRDVDRRILFGKFHNGVISHQLTNDLSGKSMDWMLTENFKIHQLYENWSCCAFVSPPPEEVPEWRDFFFTFNPTKYVRLRENLYLISFLAPGASGMEGCMLMDLKAMRAVGSVFGIDRQDILKSYTFGAQGAFAPVGFSGKYMVE